MPQVATSQGQVFYQVEGSGPLLMLRHSDGASGKEFDPVLGRLTSSYRVLVSDNPGCGRSPRRAFSHDYYKENAKAAIDLIGKVADEPVFVIGTGGGGVTALWMAILAPARVRAVVADSVVEFLDPRDVQQDISAHRDPTAEMIGFWREMNGDDWSTVVDQLGVLFANLVEQKRSLFNWRLEDLHCPVLLTGTRQDHMLCNLAPRLEKVAEQIAHSSLVLYPTGDHPSLWSQSESFWKDALAFLADQTAED
jgi:valacyclovir hydrolase